VFEVNVQPAEIGPEAPSLDYVTVKGDAWREIALRYAFGALQKVLPALIDAGIVKPYPVDLIARTLLALLRETSAEVARIRPRSPESDSRSGGGSLSGSDCRAPRKDLSSNLDRVDFRGPRTKHAPGRRHARIICLAADAGLESQRT